MVAVSVLVVLFVSLLIARVGTVALTLTGMSRESARFQAQSAFFGVGYTTTEAESVVSHPVRRRIIMAMILAGNAGVITTVGTLLLSFSGSDDTWTAVAILCGGVVVLGALALSRPVDRMLTRVIRRVLRRWTDLDVRDYAGLLELGEGYAVAELEVEETDWIAGRELGELTLRDSGVVVLGIHRLDSAYVGAPETTTTVCPGDVLTVYGLEERVEALDAGRAAAA
jgi:hypothetical protein